MPRDLAVNTLRASTRKPSALPASISSSSNSRNAFSIIMAILLQFSFFLASYPLELSHLPRTSLHEYGRSAQLMYTKATPFQRVQPSALAHCVALKRHSGLSLHTEPLQWLRQSQKSSTGSEPTCDCTTRPL